MSKITGIVFLLTFLFLTGQVFATTRYVDDDGGVGVYTTIQAAVDDAVAGDVIEIANGTYSESVTIGVNDVEFVGESYDNVIVDAPTAGSGYAFTVDGTDGLVFSNMTITNFAAGFYAGTSVANLDVSTVVFDGNDGAFDLTGSTDGMFTGLTVSNGVYGFDFAAGTGNTVTGCDVFDNSTFGVMFDGAHTGNVVTSNNIYGNWEEGVIVDGGTDFTVADNTFTGNADSVMTATIVVSGTSSGGVVDNNTVDGGYQGMAVSGTIATCQFTDNTFTGMADDGIVMGAMGTGLTLSGNTASGLPGDGLVVTGDVYGDVNGNQFNGNGGYGITVGLYTGSRLYIFDNCLWGNTAGNAADANTYASAYVRWWKSGVGNYYDHAYTGTYYIGGTGDNQDNNPQSATNNPTGPATVALGEAFTVDFEFTSAGCEPFQNMRAFDFTVSWDASLLTYVGTTDGGYVPGTFFYDDANAGTGTLVISAAAIDDWATTAAGILASVDFEAVGDAVGTATISVASTYLDKDGLHIPTTSTSLSVTVEDVTAPTFVSTALTGSPAGNTYSDDFDMTLEYELADDFDLFRLQYKIDGAGSWANITPHPNGTSTTGSYTFDISGLGLGTGSYTLNLRLRDAAPAYNETFLDLGFDVDNTAPDAPVFTVADADGCAEAGWTSGNDIIVSSSVADADMLEISQGSGFGAPVAYEEDYTYTITGGEGTYNIYLRVTDVYGNTSGYLSPESIDLDMTAPATIVGFDCPAATNDVNINCTVGAYGETGLWYAVSEDMADLTCDDATWVTPQSYGFSFTLEGTEGMHTVYMASRDAAGNVSTPVSDDVELDLTAPEFVLFDVFDPEGTECADYWLNDLDFVISGDPDEVALYYTMGDTAGNFVTVTADSVGADTYSYFHTTHTFAPVSPPDDTWMVLYATVQDDVGNVGVEVVDSIFIRYFSSAPAAGTMTINGGDTWSNDPIVTVTFPGHDADVEFLMFTLTSGDYTGATAEAYDGSDPGASITYDWTGVAEGGWQTLYADLGDCAGVMSGEVSDAIRFDFTDPVFSAMDINGGALLTNNPNVTVNMTFSDAYIWEMILSEDAAFTGASWVPDAASTSFLLSSGDGPKTIYAKVRDRAGNESPVLSATIGLDETDPGATITIVAPTAKAGGCPNAIAGYTCQLADNEVVFSDYDGDIDQMRIRNQGGSLNSGWIPFAATYTWALEGSDGTKVVEVRLLDDAGNYSDWMEAEIILDMTAPDAPTGGYARAGFSFEGDKAEWAPTSYLEWDEVTGAQFYQFNWQRTNDFPLYGSAPDWPAVYDDEFLGATGITGTDYEYSVGDEQYDIYYFSVFACDNAGNWSDSGLHLTATNYYAGDFDFSGSLDFVEFSELAAAMYSGPSDPNWEDYLDIGPTYMGDIFGYPIPDGVVNFADIVTFIFNYDYYAADKDPFQFLKPMPSVQDVTISAQLPDELIAGQEYEAIIRIDNPTQIRGLSMTFPIDNDQLEVISIEAGDMFDAEQSFIFNKVGESSFVIDGIMLDGSQHFTANNVATVKLRAKSNGILEMAPVLDVRDFTNSQISAEFVAAYMPTASIPNAFGMSQNYPNPFNPTTTIDLALPVASDWQIEIYNIAGQLVKSFSGADEAGTVPVVWDGDDMSGNKVASGIYFYKAIADNGRFTETKKMVLMK